MTFEEMAAYVRYWHASDSKLTDVELIELALQDGYIIRVLYDEEVSYEFKENEE
jgi:hypothetical protein